MMPEQFHAAVASYTATSPDMDGEGFNGYMEVDATFIVRDLDQFGKLWKDSYQYPSDRSRWYWLVKSGVDNFLDEEKQNGT